MASVSNALWVAIALLPGLACMAARAESCRLGSLRFDAPACAIETVPHRDGAAQAVEWRDGGVTYTVIAIARRHPVTARAYLARWRHDHKCTAEPLAFAPRLNGAGTAAAITWTGVCAAPERYLAHAALFGREVVELHVTRSVFDRTPLEPSLVALLERTHRIPAGPPQPR